VAWWAARRMALGCPTVGHMLTLAGETGVGETHLALAIAWAWVERFEREPWSLLTDRELRELLERGRPDERTRRWYGSQYRRPPWPEDHGVRFARVGDLLDMLQKGYEDGLYHGLMEECQTCRLLVLDDLGHQRETPWRVEVVDRILDARYVGRRWTVVTTNLPGDQLPPRIASRLRDRSTGFVAAIEAEDYRPRKSRNGRKPW
jgi:DNA replication protein DnaC